MLLWVPFYVLHFIYSMLLPFVMALAESIVVGLFFSLSLFLSLSISLFLFLFLICVKAPPLCRRSVCFCLLGTLGNICEYLCSSASEVTGHG